MIELARRILGELSAERGHSSIASDVLALVLILDVFAEDPTLGQVRDGLGYGQTAARDLVKRAESLGWVVTSYSKTDRRVTLVNLTSRAKRMRMRARNKS